ncbi:uncharacterized protein BN514_00021 [Ruminococcus sp. CAG:17]|nr:uncharacterized protein BN514_00021 [Ruminococcus sp. CAG:17]
MLSTGTAASVGINTDIIIIDLNVQIFLDIRHNITGYKRCLSLSCRIKRGNTYKTVNTFLGFQITVGVLSVYLEGYGFHTGLITVKVIQYFQCKSFFLRPSAVHTVKHSTPVACLCTTGSCVQLNDGILSVILSGKKCLHTDAVKACLEFVQHFLDLRDDLRIILLISHLDHGFHIFHLCFQIMVCLNIILETL